MPWSSRNASRWRPRRRNPYRRRRRRMAPPSTVADHRSKTRNPRCLNRTAPIPCRNSSWRVSSNWVKATTSCPVAPGRASATTIDSAWLKAPPNSGKRSRNTAIRITLPEIRQPHSNSSGPPRRASRGSGGWRSRQNRNRARAGRAPAERRTASRGARWRIARACRRPGGRVGTSPCRGVAGLIEHALGPAHNPSGRRLDGAAPRPRLVGEDARSMPHVEDQHGAGSQVSPGGG